MNNISDYGAHKRDEEWDNSADAERLWRMAPKCPTCELPLIAGRGWRDLNTGEAGAEYYPKGKCPNCGWEPI